MSLLSHHEDGPAPAPQGGGGLRKLLIGAVVLALAGAGVLLWLWSAPEPEPASPEPAAERPAAPRGGRTASLRVTADVEGAEVFVDGKRLGLAPVTAGRLEPGSHRIRVERFGRRPWSEEVELRAGDERELRASLEPDATAGAPALRVDADVSGASVFLDREFVGHTPVRIAELPPGPHRLNVSAEGYEMHAETLEGGAEPRTIMVRFRVVRLDETVAVEHKRAFGSRKGTLHASVDGLRFDSEKPEDSFQVGFDQLEEFEVDYLDDNLKVKIRGGRTYNFTSQSGDPDELFVFHRDVQEARARLEG